MLVCDAIVISIVIATDKQGERDVQQLFFFFLTGSPNVLLTSNLVTEFSKAVAQ